jgi:hypothetical protein
MNLNEQVAKAIGWCLHTFEDADGMLKTRRSYKGRHEPFYQCLICSGWFDSEDYHKYTSDYLPDFTTDHNAVFEILVPYMESKGWRYAIDNHDEHVCVKWTSKSDNFNYHVHADKSLCIAVIKAVLKALGQEVSDE